MTGPHGWFLVSFLAALGLHCFVRTFVTLSWGCSLCRACTLGCVCTSSCGAQVSWCTTCEIFPVQWLNRHPLHRQADSQPLGHQGSPMLISILCVCTALRKVDCKGRIKDGKSRICWGAFPKPVLGAKGRRQSSWSRLHQPSGKLSLTGPLWGSLESPSSLPLQNAKRLIWGGIHSFWGFPGHSVVKTPPANAGDEGSIPGPERAPGEGNDSPVQHACLENFTDRGAWRA